MSATQFKRRGELPSAKRWCQSVFGVVSRITRRSACMRALASMRICGVHRSGNTVPLIDQWNTTSSPYVLAVRPLKPVKVGQAIDSCAVWCVAAARSARRAAARARRKWTITCMPTAAVLARVFELEIIPIFFWRRAPFFYARISRATSAESPPVFKSPSLGLQPRARQYAAELGRAAGARELAEHGARAAAPMVPGHMPELRLAAPGAAARGHHVGTVRQLQGRLCCPDPADQLQRAGEAAGPNVSEARPEEEGQARCTAPRPPAHWLPRTNALVTTHFCARLCAADPAAPPSVQPRARSSAAAEPECVQSLHEGDARRCLAHHRAACAAPG